jgi:hypothetical protein
LLSPLKSKEIITYLIFLAGGGPLLPPGPLFPKGLLLVFMIFKALAPQLKYFELVAKTT